MRISTYGQTLLRPVAAGGIDGPPHAVPSAVSPTPRRFCFLPRDEFAQHVKIAIKSSGRSDECKKQGQEKRGGGSTAGAGA